MKVLEMPSKLKGTEPKEKQNNEIDERFCSTLVDDRKE